ncbi:hypothetical protein [Cryptosporangium minutisporangium]|uniref:hypothetical protein n=1 Tax=Cryptosporangium minutisporangium TaxID=113569 RepID=UPI0031EB88C6
MADWLRAGSRSIQLGVVVAVLTLGIGLGAQVTSDGSAGTPPLAVGLSAALGIAVLAAMIWFLAAIVHARKLAGPKPDASRAATLAAHESQRRGVPATDPSIRALADRNSRLLARSAPAFLTVVPILLAGIVPGLLGDMIISRVSSGYSIVVLGGLMAWQASLWRRANRYLAASEAAPVPH